jgi:DNA ligase (NAD+)
VEEVRLLKNFKTVPTIIECILDNSYSKEDLIDWEKRTEGRDVPLEYTCELKYDGASMYHL